MSRLARFLLLGLLTAILIGYIGPVRSYFDQRAELGRQYQALHEQEQTRERLIRQTRALERPEVLEARARALGLVRPGERAYIVRGLPDEPEPPGDDRDDGGFWGWLAERL